MPEPLPFERSADLYDLMYEQRDYAAAAAEVHALLRAELPGARDLLDVGCGTGRHLEQLSRWYRGEGLDLNPRLLERARARCPDVAFHLDDMTSFQLGRSFDAIVCLFSAIAHVRTAEAMRRSVERMAAHLRAPGLLLIEPWFTPESFWDGHLAVNFQSDSETKLAWMYRQHREGLVSVLDIHYLVGGEGEPEYRRERQDLGLFGRDEMTAALEGAGLSVDYRESETWDRGLYVARRG